ncbi:hypothetical protein [Paraburkholderia sp. HD33-4]|uniref:hypothetical protein n=1 Tax=Paraburkholderia sp. HD33-4 TaxID=2883242 RepID=UPI001F338488|nr:hypothetical protein [Paraburkholderia sp. HD33-4]
MTDSKLLAEAETIRPTDRTTGADIPQDAPLCFHLLVKPSGSTCNIDCQYGFCLSRDALYPGGHHRMSEATLETGVRQLLESHRTPHVTVAWQGGDPTLMRLDFFRKAVSLVEEYRKPGRELEHVLGLGDFTRLSAIRDAGGRRGAN